MVRKYLKDVIYYTSARSGNYFKSSVYVHYKFILTFNGEADTSRLLAIFLFPPKLV